MNENRKKYISLQKEFFKKNSKDNIRLMFEFMEELEKERSQVSKEVLVDVYTILGFKMKAYELLNEIIDKKDKKALKKLGYLLDQSKTYGDKFAYIKPKTENDLKIEENLLKKLPFFKYHPNPFETETFERVEKPLICECCEKPTNVVYSRMYAVKDINCLCPVCISNGSAAKKFDGQFIQDADLIDDIEKTKELFERTPGYYSWQGEYWLSCCNDYCEYLGNVGTSELEEMGIADEVFTEYEKRGEYSEVRDYLTSDGSVVGYLFRCLHCKKYHLYVDAD